MQLKLKPHQVAVITALCDGRPIDTLGPIERHAAAEIAAHFRLRAIRLWDGMPDVPSGDQAPIVHGRPATRAERVMGVAGE